MTLLSDLGSALAVARAGLLADFDSIFLFVTDTFGFSGTCFAPAPGEGFAFDVAAFADVFGAAFASACAGALFTIFALPTGLAAAAFFTAGFAIDWLFAGLVAAKVAFFAV